MCKNHQHLVASTVQANVLADGDVLYIVETKIDSVMIQTSVGATLQVPCSMMLLLPLHPQATVFSSPDHLMAGLGALWSVSEMIDSELGAEEETNVIPFSPSLSIDTLDQED
jgi:hypothetical protein